MKKVILAVLTAISLSLPAIAQPVQPQVVSSFEDLMAVCSQKSGETVVSFDDGVSDIVTGTPIEVLLKRTNYSSEALSKTLDQAWKLYQNGCTDINATAQQGNTILHLIVRATPDQWPTKLDQWIKAGVRDVPNTYGKTALQELEEDMRNIIKDNRSHRSAISYRLPAEYTQARRVLKNTPEEKQRREMRRQAEQELHMQMLENIAKTDK